MEHACRDLSNVAIFLFTQNLNSLTGFKIPLFHPHLEPYKTGSSGPCYLKSSPKTYDFLEKAPLWNKKTKVRIVLIPKNQKLKLECPIEIARLSVRLFEKEQKSSMFDDFKDIEVTEADKPDETAEKLNQVMGAMVSGCLLSPFIGIDSIKGNRKQKMIAQKFMVSFKVDSVDMQGSRSVRKKMQKTQLAEEEEGIIVINPENEGFEDTIKKRAEDKKSREEQHEMQENLNEDLDDLNECSALSRDGSESDSIQPFMGKTYGLNWRVHSVDSLAEITLQIHDNLNSICSFIKKTHLEEKSIQPKRRTRFLSEDTKYEVNVIRRRNFRNERNNSFMNLGNLNKNKLIRAPFKILKDEIIEKCLSKKGQRVNLSKEDFKRVQLVVGEEKSLHKNSTVEAKWMLRLKPERGDKLIKPETPKVDSNQASLKLMFQLSKFLKVEMRKEMRVNKKRIRCSEHSMKAKRSDGTSTNFYTEQNSRKTSEKYFSIKDQRKESYGEKKGNSKKKTSSNSLSRNMDFEIDEDERELGEQIQKINTLIKFKRHF